MSNAISGGITLSSSLAQSLDAGATRLNQFTAPVQPSQTISYGPGTGPGQANKIYQASLSLAATPTSLDLTAVVCLDGSTGFSHVREVIVFNDDTNDAHTIVYDGSVSNAFAPFLAGTGPKITIQGGASERKSRPLGTNGWTVDSTHKVVALDPGANTVACRVVIVGD